MNRRWVFVLAALLCFPAVVLAQAYKCNQPDGSVSYQDQPCQADTKESRIKLEPSRKDPARASDQSRAAETFGRRPPGQQPTMRDLEKRRAEEEEVRAHNDEVNTYNKSQRCNYARQQLGVLKEARPVYRRDNEGNRRYVEDNDRAGEIAAAEQRVATECQ